MKKDPSYEPETNLKEEKSFEAAIEQMALMLRKQIKLSERSTKILPSTSFPSSFKSSFEQIAKLLRKEIHAAKPPRKRVWKTKKAPRD